MKENKTNPEIFDDVVHGCLGQEIMRCFAEMEGLKDNLEKIPFETAIQMVEDANKTINLFCGKNVQLYDKYRYRVFVLNNKLSIAQGEEIDVDIRRKVDQTPNDYK